MTAVLGIDPGQAGGIALLEDGQLAKAWKMPDTEHDVFDLILDAAAPVRAIAYIELAHSMPKQGVASSFKFGVGYGGLRMALIAAEVPFHTVQPHVWQAATGSLGHGDKNVTKRRAQEWFPGIQVTHALADALLIAAYGYRQLTNQSWPGA